jgi:hypothetical protein
MQIERPRAGEHRIERRKYFVADMKPPASAGAADSAPDRRRSHRVQIAMGLLVRGASGAVNFQEETKTISVSAHGCMVHLAAKVARGQQITIINKKTAEELGCTVTYLGQTDGAKAEVGIEFTEASPVFWRIAFPPENWDPSERKRASATHHVAPPKLPRR